MRFRPPKGWDRESVALFIHDSGVRVERRPASTVWVRLEGLLPTSSVNSFTEKLRNAMAPKKERVVLDLTRLTTLEESAAKRLAEGLRLNRDRIRVILPARVGEVAALAAIFAVYH